MTAPSTPSPTQPTSAPLAPKVSVMIPTFNQAQYLERALQSALAQDYPNLEIIVADDASSDPTPDIVKPYLTDPRVRYVRNAHNLGRVGNYHKTLTEVAAGKYVLNLDGDDWLLAPSYLSRAVTYLERDPDVVMVFCNEQRFDEARRSYHVDSTKNPYATGVLDGTQLFLDYPEGAIAFPHLCTLYRKQKATEIGFYTEDIIGSDSQSILRLLLGHKVAFINELGGVWRSHAQNASRGKEARKLVDNLRFIDTTYLYALSLGTPSRRALGRWRYRMLRGYCFDTATDMLRRGDVGAMRRFLALLLERRPRAVLAMLDIRLPLTKLVRKMARWSR